jgi:amidase
LVDHYLARIEAYGEQIGAFVTVTPDAAREAAAALPPPGPDAGPLYGVPTAIKDLNLTAGVRTTFGSLAFADFVPTVDADVVTALRAAGTVSLGKTQTAEFGVSLYSENEVAPAARNPWAPGFTAGGSSGGAAAAVAAGLVAFAQGGDGGGSIRIPAAICGLVGFKPSRGLVSGGPLGWGSFGLPTNGPIARDVADVAAALDAMAAPVVGEPYPHPGRPAHGFLHAATNPSEYLAGRTIRIGVVITPMLSDPPVDEDCLAAVRYTAGTLADLGHPVQEAPPPFHPGLTPHFETLWQVMTMAAPVPPERETQLLPITRLFRERGAAVTVPGLITAQAELQNQVRAVGRTHQDFDLLLCPVLARPQVEVGYFTAAGDPAWDFEQQKQFSPFCAPFNVIGGPSISLPVWRTRSGGLPVGIQLASVRPGDDALVLAVAARLMAATPRDDRHPALFHSAASATVKPGVE